MLDSVWKYAFTSYMRTCILVSVCIKFTQTPTFYNRLNASWVQVRSNFCVIQWVNIISFKRTKRRQSWKKLTIKNLSCQDARLHEKDFRRAILRHHLVGLARQNLSVYSRRISFGTHFVPSLHFSPLSDIIKKFNLSCHFHGDDSQLYWSFQPTMPGDRDLAVSNIERCVHEIDH